MIDAIVKACVSVVGDHKPAPLHAPRINGLESKYVNACLTEGIEGDQWVRKLEATLVDYCGVAHAVGVNSGTAALHVALLAGGVKPGDEVICPALTFIATANAITYCGATPNFVDGSLSINPYKLLRYLERSTCPNPAGRGRLNCKTGKVISTLVAVDLLGFPADYPKLAPVCEEFGLTLIEDAAQALGATLGNQHCGSFGKVATFIFNNNKIVTGNGGGAVLTNDPWVAAKAWQLATTSRLPHPWRMDHDQIAFNYRLPNINAALALAQLEQLPSFLSAKHKLLSKYEEAFQGIEGVELLKAKAWQGNPNYWLVAILLKPKFADQRDPILKALHQHNIQARALFTPLHKLDIYAHCPHDTNLLSAEDAFDRTVCLPSGVGLVQ